MVLLKIFSSIFLTILVFFYDDFRKLRKIDVMIQTNIKNFGNIVNICVSLKFFKNCSYYIVIKNEINYRKINWQHKVIIKLSIHTKLNKNILLLQGNKDSDNYFR